MIDSRDRKTLFAAFIGLIGVTCTWLSAQIDYNQMLCIRKTTLVFLGAGLAAAARIAGILFGLSGPKRKGE